MYFWGSPKYLQMRSQTGYYVVALESVLWSSCTFLFLQKLPTVLLNTLAIHLEQTCDTLLDKKVITLCVQCSTVDTEQEQCVLCWRPPFYRVPQYHINPARYIQPAKLPPSKCSLATRCVQIPGKARATRRDLTNALLVI